MSTQRPGGFETEVSRIQCLPQTHAVVKFKTGILDQIPRVWGMCPNHDSKPRVSCPTASKPCLPTHYLGMSESATQHRPLLRVQRKVEFGRGDPGPRAQVTSYKTVSKLTMMQSEARSHQLPCREEASSDDFPRCSTRYSSLRLRDEGQETAQV